MLPLNINASQTANLKEMTKLLSSLVALDTDKKSHLEQNNNPKIIAFGEVIKTTAQKFGLQFKNYNNFAFEVRLPGKSSKDIAFYTHADVVPVTIDEWVLEDGNKLKPFNLTEIGDKLYGRGTIDDKSAIVDALFAMKKIKASNLKLKNTLRLIITTSEETSGKGIKYFLAHNKLPNINIGLDGGFPIVIAENGVGSLKLFFNKVKNNSNKQLPTITSFTGAKANNIIPKTARAIINTHDKLINTFKKIATKFINENGNNFSIKFLKINSNSFEIITTGRSVHSSQPENGINPVARLLEYLFVVNKDIKFSKNEFLNAVKVNHDLIGLDYYGNKLGVAYSDPFMGKLVISPTDTNIDKNGFKLGLNIRAPRGKTSKQLSLEISQILSDYNKSNDLHFKSVISLGDYMISDKSSPEIKLLQKVYTKVTKQKASLESIRGYTSMHVIPGGITFGPNPDGMPYLGHKANEYVTKKTLLDNLNIYHQAMQALSVL